MMMDSQAWSGSPTEAHTFIRMPQCTKCTEFQPSYKYFRNVGEEALKLTCRRCGYVWLMMCASDHDLA